MKDLTHLVENLRGIKDVHLNPEQRLARDINSLHRSAIESGQKALTSAIECGKLLAVVKEGIGHGGWLDWLENNYEGNARTAQRFMRLASNPTALSDLNADTITDALAHLSAPKKRTAPTPDQESPEIVPPSPLVLVHTNGFRKAEPTVIDAELIDPEPLVIDGTGRMPFPTGKTEGLTDAARARGVEAEKDSENLWLLKSTWSKTSKKDRAAFIEWAISRNGGPLASGTGEGPKDNAPSKRKSPVKIFEREGMRIWAVAKGHLDRINRHDEFWEEALRECLAYCHKRLAQNK